MRTCWVCAAAVAALVIAAPAGAQVGALRFADPTVLVGPGSSIGVHARDLSADDLKQAKLDAGVYIDEVLEGTPAARAGLKKGDIVTEFDGERVRSVRGFKRLVTETPPQRTVKAAILRDGGRRTLDITPEGASADRAFNGVRLPPGNLLLRPLPVPAPLLPDAPRFEIGPAVRRLGVTLSALRAPDSQSDQLANYFGVTSGVLVVAVDGGSPAARTGLKAGDVITGAGGLAVESPGDVMEAVRMLSGNGALELKVQRDRKELTLKVTFDSAPTGAAQERLPV